MNSESLELLELTVVNILTPTTLPCCGSPKSYHLLLLNLVLLLFYAPQLIAGERELGMKGKDGKSLDWYFRTWLLAFAKGDVWFQNEGWGICLLPGLASTILPT